MENDQHPISCHLWAIIPHFWQWAIFNVFCLVQTQRPYVEGWGMGAFWPWNLGISGPATGVIWALQAQSGKKSSKWVHGASRPWGFKSPQNRLFFNYFHSFLTAFWLFGPAGLRGPRNSFRTLLATLGPKGPYDPCSGQKFSQPETLFSQFWGCGQWHVDPTLEAGGFATLWMGTHIDASCKKKVATSWRSLFTPACSREAFADKNYKSNLCTGTGWRAFFQFFFFLETYTIVCKIITRMKLLFSNCLGDYIAAFGGSSN